VNYSMSIARWAAATVPAAAIFCVTSNAAAVPVLVDEEKGIAFNVGALIQPWLQLTAPGAEGEGSAGIGSPNGSPNFDFYLRRARILVFGSVTKELSFFIDTDQPNYGKNGDYTTPPMFVQDAFFSYAFMPEFKIDAGMMLLPLSHHTIEGASGLHALDYHGLTVRLPGSKVFRDTGVQFRGVLLNDKLAYRVGVFEGVRYVPPAVPALAPAVDPPAVNPSGLPRITGQLRFNVMGAENDFFLKGIYFSPTPIVSVGVGMDYQGDAVLAGTPAEPKAHTGLSADVFAELPFSEEDELIVKGNVFLYGDGAPGLPTGGTTFYAEAGFRHGWLEPLAFVDVVAADNVNVLAPHLGVNFWINKYTFNTKIDVGYITTETTAMNAMTMMETTTTTKDIVGTLQGQVSF
jgi:hypothetical protein